MKDSGLFLIILGAIALVIVGRATRRTRPSDVLSGMFDGGWQLGWPRGVQEEDSVRPWGDPRRPGTTGDDGSENQVPTIEDID